VAHQYPVARQYHAADAPRVRFASLEGWTLPRAGSAPLKAFTPSRAGSAPLEAFTPSRAGSASLEGSTRPSSRVCLARGLSTPSGGVRSTRGLPRTHPPRISRAVTRTCSRTRVRAFNALTQQGRATTLTRLGIMPRRCFANSRRKAIPVAVQHCAARPVSAP
jgi:hypothetical protein